jgi:hypothetical protein
MRFPAIRYSLLDELHDSERSNLAGFTERKCSESGIIRGPRTTGVPETALPFEDTLQLSPTPSQERQWVTLARSYESRSHHNYELPTSVFHLGIANTVQSFVKIPVINREDAWTSSCIYVVLQYHET